MTALWQVGFEVREGEAVVLLGANGAGKTTCLKTISGVLKPAGGEIRFRGESLIGLPPHRVAQLGVIHVPEGRRVFPELSVLDNLALGARGRPDPAVLDQVYTLFPRLHERRTQLAGTLSGGEQQMLAIGRGLMSRPRLLMLDEPSMGLAPVIIEQILAAIQSLQASGVTLLIVEQNAALGLRVAQRGYVLSVGRVVLTGSASELTATEDVRRAYLGQI